jgi:hypothetical protein
MLSYRFALLLSFRVSIIVISILTCVSVASAQSPAPPTFSPTKLPFDGQFVGSTSDKLSITLSNTGTVALPVSNVTVTGTNSGDFVQSHNCGTSVAAGANCTILVAFKPSGVGSRTASLAITDGAAGSPHTVSLTGAGNGVASIPQAKPPVCKSTLNGAIAYADLKSYKVSLPYGTPFSITGDVAQVKFGGTAVSNLISPQSVTGDYISSDGDRGGFPDTAIEGSSWNVPIGKLSPESSVTINFRFSGPLSPSLVQTIFGELQDDPVFLAARSQFVTSAEGKASAAQLSAMSLLAQSAATVVTASLKRRGLVPKNPDDLKTALTNALANNIAPVFNIQDSFSQLKTTSVAASLATTLGITSSEIAAMSPQQLADKIRTTKTMDYSKAGDTARQTEIRQAVEGFIQDYDFAVGGLNDGLKGALFTGSASLAVGSDQASDVVCDLQKYAGFDIGALYSSRLSELRAFAMVHIYFGPVQMKTVSVTNSGFWEGVRQRTSMAFGVALQDISGSTSSKISGQNAFVYGVGVRLNKYFRLTVGGMLYRTVLPAVNGSTSPANGTLRHEFVVGPSIDVTALPGLQSIFSKSKS